MSDKSPPKQIINTLPESFYDILAYLIPGSIFVFFNIFLIENLRDCILEIYNTGTALFDKILIAILSFFVIYVIGQILTSVSWLIINIILGLFSKCFKRKKWLYKEESELWLPINKDFDRDWTSDFILIRSERPDIGLEVTKRYARYILSRNNSLAGITILISAFITSGSLPIIIGIIVFILLSLFDTYYRRCWFLSYIDKTATKINELRT